MVSGKYKSGRLRKIFRKSPGSRVKIHYKERKPNNAHCTKCGAPLHGVPRAKPSKMHNLAKSSKTPSRPFGGNLCSSCSKRRIKDEART
jgi:large subunit ribosomal protein L34e